MKYIVLIGIVIILLITWQFNFPIESESSSEGPRAVSLNEIRDKDLNTSPKLKANREVNTSELASIKNEFIALNLPTSIEDFETEGLPDKENGAYYLKQAISLIEDNPAFDKLKKLTEKDFSELSEEEINQLKIALNSSDAEQLFDLLEDAARQDGYDWKLDYSQGYNLILPHLGSSRRLQRIQNLKVELLLQQGNEEAAVQALETALKTGLMASDGGTLIGELVQVANYSIMSKSLDKTGYDKSIYEALSRELNKVQERQLKTIAGERILFGDFAFDKFRSTEPHELILQLGEDKSLVENLTPGSLDKDHAFFLQYMLGVRQQLESPDQNTSNKIKGMSKELVENRKEYQLTSRILPSWETIVNKYHAYQTSLKINMVSMKLKEYQEQNGYYPETLEDLGLRQELVSDVLSGSSFNYKKDGESVSLSPKTDFGKRGKNMTLKTILN